jgi:hypothetical protein
MGLEVLITGFSPFSRFFGDRVSPQGLQTHYDRHEGGLYEQDPSDRLPMLDDPDRTLTARAG